jgi:glycosyltransferase involved in cell wall biosynthesis
MRLLNIIASLDPAGGGPIEGSLRLADIWGVQGHEIMFATADFREAPFLPDRKVPVATLGKIGAPRRRKGPLRLHERYGYSPDMIPWLQKNLPEFDATIVHGLWNYTTWAARRALLASGTPYFVFPHGCLDPWFRHANPRKHFVKQLLWPINEGALMNNAAAVLFTTEDERLLAQDAFRPYHVHGEVVGFGCTDVEGDEARQVRAFRESFPALGERRFILFLSRIQAKKGCDLLIGAFAGIADSNPDLDLVMAGPDQTGWKAELEAMAQTLGIGHRVHWTGMIDGEVKWGAFRACEAFALTSHTENFGIVVAEALACGKPVLITNKVNLWREVAAERAGLVEPDTQEGANRLLTRFLTLDAEQISNMRSRARLCFERHFRMETAAANILDVIKARVSVR